MYKKVKKTPAKPGQLSRMSISDGPKKTIDVDSPVKLKEVRESSVEISSIVDSADGSQTVV